MPPHIFRVFSDDPTRLEKQIGCMTGFFQMFEQHQRAPRPPPLAPHDRMDSSVTKPFPSPITRGPRKTSKDHRKASSGDVSSSSAGPYCKHNAKSSNNKGFSSSCRHRDSCNVTGQPNSSPMVPRFTWYVEDQPAFIAEQGEFSRNSPSILDSSRSTAAIREPPRKSFNASDLDNFSRRCSHTKPTPGSHYEPTKSSMQPSFEQSRTSLDSRETSWRSFDPQRKDLRLETSKDPLASLKESIRTLATLQQATQEFVYNLEAPRLDSDITLGYLEKSPWPAYDGREPARCSSFDYTEAIRISQKIKETPPRHSLDGRDIPKSILRLRDAVRSHLGGLDCPLGENPSSPLAGKRAPRSARIASSNPSSRREPVSGFRPVSNVIARLMGLEDLPSSDNKAKFADATQMKTPLKEAVTTFDIMQKPVDTAKAEKPSKEARLLKELLHCKPRADTSGAQAKTRERRCTEEGQPALQTAEEHSLQWRPSDNSNYELIAPIGRTLSKDPGRIDETPRHMKASPVTNNLESNPPKCMDASEQAFAIKPPKTQERRPVERATENHERGDLEHQAHEGTQLEQRIASFQEDGQRRLRLLRTFQNSLTERKTMKEILHLKSLLNPPQMHHAVDKLKEGSDSRWSHLDELSIKQRQVAAISDKEPAFGELVVLPNQGDRRPITPYQNAQSIRSATGHNVFGKAIVIIKPRLSRAPAGEADDHSLVDLSSSPCRPRSAYASEVDTSRMNNSRPSKQQRIILSEPRKLGESTAIDIQPLGRITTDRSCKSKTPRDARRRQPLSSSPLQPARVQCASPPPRKASPRKQTSKALVDGDGDVLRIKLQTSTAHYVGNNGASNQPSSLKKSSMGTVKRSISNLPVIDATSTGGRVVEAEGCPKGQKAQVPSKNNLKSRGQEESALGDKVEGGARATGGGNSIGVSEVHKSAREMLDPDHGRTKSSETVEAITSGLEIESCYRIDSCQAGIERQSEDITTAESPSKLCMADTKHGHVEGGRGYRIQELSSTMSGLNLADELKIIVPATDVTPSQAADGDTTSKEAEIRSPISVLDHHEDHNFLFTVETEQSSRGKTSRDRIAKLDYSAGDGSCEFEYVRQVLVAAGLLAEDSGAILQAWVSSGSAIPPGVFVELEPTWTASSNFSRSHLQLIFDSVNEIVAARLMSATTYPANPSWMPSGQELLRTVWADLRRLFPRKRSSRKGSETRSNRIFKLLQADLEERTDSRAPIAELVLHLEQMILAELFLEL